MSPNWKKELTFFLDPQLKIFDRDFHKTIIQDLDALEIRWNEDFSKIFLDKHLPNIFLILSETHTDPLVREQDYVLVFGSSNMSLFGKKEFNGNVQNINELSDWKKFVNSLVPSFKTVFEKAFESLVANSQETFKKLSKGLDIKNLEYLNEKKFLVELELLGQASFSQGVENASRIAKELLDLEIFLLPPEKSYRHFKNTLPLDLNCNPMFFCWNYEGKETETLWFFSLVEELLEARGINKKKESYLDDMQLILSDLPVALALFNEKDELLLHNPLFLQLSLGSKQCLSLGNSEQFTQNGELYRTQVVELEKHQAKLFYFIPIREFLGESSSPSSEELGIITSSIAHELNNPLGGISGALDVILLDEHAYDVELRLREMKAGVARCKKLVETFLGFSKLKAESVFCDSSYTIKSCMDSAIDLIRFRLIENNINLEANFKSENCAIFDYNPHVLSMTLYLMLGDLLTNFGHQKLVANDRSTTFDMEFVEREKSIEVKTKDGLKLGEDFIKSKLLNHLLEIQGLVIKTRQSSIYLKCL